MANYSIGITLTGTDNASGALKGVTDKIDALASKSDDAAGKGSKLNTALEGMKNQVLGAVTAWASWKLVEKIAEIKDLGDKVNSAKAAFTELNGGVGPAKDALDKLREATGGVVDDLTLMQGANKLLMMGLADSGEEAAKLTGIATTLGRVMGQDAQSAVGDFAALLANQSIPRLDNFGISSSRVRQRIDELIKSGQALSREDAFTMAVLEEGTRAIEKLGPAADAGINAIDRLGTRISNFAQEQAGNVATGANAIAGLLEIAAGQNPIQIQQRENADAAAKAFVDAYTPAFIEYAGMTGLVPEDVLKDLGGQVGRDMLKGIAYELEMNPQADIGNLLFTQWGIRSDSELGQGLASAIKTTREMAQAAIDNEMANVEFSEANQRWRDMVTGIFSVPGELWQKGGEVAQALLKAADSSGLLDKLEADRKRAAQEQAEARKFFDGMISDIASFSNQLETAVARVPARLLALGQVGEYVRQMQTGIGSAYGTAFQYQPGGMNDFQLGRLQGGGLEEFQMPKLPQFMTPEQAELIRGDYHDAVLEVEKLQRLADEGLINDSELEKAKGLKDNLGLMANEAERAAAAFENMKLSDVLGTGGGGMEGEISDLVLQRMKENGASDAQIAAMKRALDLQSGRETTQSLFMKEQVVPKIAGMSPAQAAAVQGNLAGAFGAAALMGIQPWQMTNMSLMMGIGPNGQPISTMNPEMLARLGAGQGPEILKSGISGMMGLLGIGGGGLAVEAEKAKTPFEEIKVATDTAYSKVAAIHAKLVEMAGGTYNVKINVDVGGSGAGFVTGAGPGFGPGTMGAAVRNNGGTVPGMRTRTVER